MNFWGLCNDRSMYASKYQFFCVIKKLPLTKIYGHNGKKQVENVHGLLDKLSETLKKLHSSYVHVNVTRTKD